MLSPAQDLLGRVFGYERFRGQQETIIAHVIGGGDGLVLMPTGGGKSLCYQIPALVRDGAAVVVSPLIALMRDQVAALLQVGVGGGPLGQQRDQLRLREGRGKLDRRIQHGRRQIGEQRVDVGDTDPLEHPGAVGLGGRDIRMWGAAGGRGHGRQLASTSARYPAASSIPSSSAPSEIRTRISHPSP